MGTCGRRIRMLVFTGPGRPDDGSRTPVYKAEVSPSSSVPGWPDAGSETPLHMWPKADRFVVSHLLLDLDGHKASQELLYVAEGGPVGRLPALTGPGWPDDGSGTPVCG
jgi:hypothetical protein